MHLVEVCRFHENCADPPFLKIVYSVRRPCKGDVEKKSCGHVRYSTITRFSRKRLPMEERIKGRTLRERQKICVAFKFSMSSTQSTFSDVENEKKENTGSAMLPYAFILHPSLECALFPDLLPLECALFPDLYPFTSWCDRFVQVVSHQRRIFVPIYPVLLLTTLRIKDCISSTSTDGSGALQQLNTTCHSKVVQYRVHGDSGRGSDRNSQTIATSHVVFGRSKLLGGDFHCTRLWKIH